MNGGYEGRFSLLELSNGMSWKGLEREVGQWHVD